MVSMPDFSSRSCTEGTEILRFWGVTHGLKSSIPSPFVLLAEELLGVTHKFVTPSSPVPPVLEKEGLGTSPSSSLHEIPRS